MATWQTGDAISVGWGDATVQETVPGSILLASANARSLVIEFDAILGGYVGTMPLLQDDDGVYRTLGMGEVVKIWTAVSVGED
jgi:hypothetical protein